MHLLNILVFLLASIEAHIFDWPNTPHATANASSFPRPSIQITGLKSEKTREIIANGSRDTVWTLE